MGRGALAKVRWRNERIRKKRERDRRKRQAAYEVRRAPVPAEPTEPSPPA
ncbi:MAG: hypothetical protein ACRD29_09765 [Acidimicrobiales bacterium]